MFQEEKCMPHDDLVSQYNYAEFTPENYKPWMNFSSSPALGEPAPNFPLWRLDGTKITLDEIWSKHQLTIMEFGSFT
jgi:hypothetical protein